LTWDSSPLGRDAEAELGPAGDVGCVVVILAMLRGRVAGSQCCAASRLKKEIWSQTLKRRRYRKPETSSRLIDLHFAPSLSGASLGLVWDKSRSSWVFYDFCA
jgi:hypothetical protein